MYTHTYTGSSRSSWKMQVEFKKVDLKIFHTKIDFSFIPFCTSFWKYSTHINMCKHRYVHSYMLYMK